MSTIKPHLAAIECPDILRSLPGWLIWRFEHHEGEPKPRKVPYYTAGNRRHGVQGRPEDRQQLTTFDAARAAAVRRGFDGLGFAPMPEWGVTALDFDKCIADGGLHPDVERVVAGTYAEYSPSGVGVRAFLRGSLGNRKDNDPAKPFGFETFSSKGFVTVTGNRLELTDLTDSANTVAEVGPEVLALCTTRFGAAQAPDVSHSTSGVDPLGLSTAQLQEALDVLPKDLEYDAWLRVGMALHHETAGEGFELWDEWSATSGKYTTREYGEMKWASFGRQSGRPTTVHYLVRLANEHGAHIDIASAAVADFDVLEPPAPEASAAAGKAPRFTVVPAGEFASGKPPAWMVKGVLPAADLVVLFGESGSGKTFVALDIAAAVARGIPWRGARTRQGRVVYVAAEGGGGFRNRLKAYAARHELELADLQLGVIHAAPNLLLKDDALDVCKAIIAAGGADLVVVDTFAQVIPGANENAADDMGKALAHCRGIRVATGALVLLVHHSGKNAAKGARGWSGLKAAADAEIEVVRMPTGRLVRVSKQKDGEDGLAWGFDLDVLPVGADEDGDVITSCVVREADLPVVQQVDASSGELGALGRQIVAVVSEFCQAQTAGIEIDAVVTAVAERMPAPAGGGRDTRKQRAKARLMALIEAEKVPYEIDGDCLSVF